MRLSWSVGNILDWQVQMCSGAHFTNNFSITIQMWWKFHFAPIQILIKWSLQYLAHGTTAGLSWHVPNFVAIWSPVIELEPKQEHVLHIHFIVLGCPALFNITKSKSGLKPCIFFRINSPTHGQFYNCPLLMKRTCSIWVNTSLESTNMKWLYNSTKIKLNKTTCLFHDMLWLV